MSTQFGAAIRRYIASESASESARTEEITRNGPIFVFNNVCIFSPSFLGDIRSCHIRFSPTSLVLESTRASICSSTKERAGCAAGPCLGEPTPPLCGTKRKRVLQQPNKCWTRFLFPSREGMGMRQTGFCRPQPGSNLSRATTTPPWAISAPTIHLSRSDLTSARLALVS